MNHFAHWVAYFERNRAQRAAIAWEQGIRVEPQMQGALVRSLQRFQIGEQGDGAHLKRGARSAGDPTYVAAVELFIREEQEHARLLAQILAALGAPLLRWHWSDACFTVLRRLLGLRWEVLVLLVAEIVGRCYYQTLHERLSDPVLRSIFGQIARDEASHLDFHCEYLHYAFAPLPAVARSCVRATWVLFFRSVCLVAAWDHAALLRALWLTPNAFRRDCDLLMQEAAAQIFGPATALEPAASAILRK
jgi:hypothetical protein